MKKKTAKVKSAIDYGWVDPNKIVEITGKGPKVSVNKISAAEQYYTNKLNRGAKWKRVSDVFGQCLAAIVIFACLIIFLYFFFGGISYLFKFNNKIENLEDKVTHLEICIHQLEEEATTKLIDIDDAEILNDNSSEVLQKSLNDAYIWQTQLFKKHE